MGTAGLRYDAVLFDVGGTLLGFTDWVPFQQFLARAGLPAGEQDGRALHHRFLSVLRAERHKAVGVGAEEGGFTTFWRGVFLSVWAHRPDLAEEMLLDLRSNRFDRVFPDAIPALESLLALGLRLAVISNFPAGLEAMLDDLGLGRYFEFVIASAQVAVAKPDPRIFALAVSRLELPRHRLLYVGDDVADDVHGALDAGLDAVLVDRDSRHSEAACPRIGSLLELAGYVLQPHNQSN